MNEPKMWMIGGVLFLAAAALMFVNDNVVVACAFVAIGLSFIVMPRFLGSKGRKRP